MRFPVFTAFGAGISYVTSHFLTLLRITWLPALLLMAVMVYFMPTITQMQIDMIALEESGADQAAIFSAMGKSMKAQGGMLLASALFYPMMIAGVLKHVVRGEAPRLPFYLWYGADEFRVFITYIVLIVMFILSAIAAALGMLVIGLIAGMAGDQAGGIFVGVVALALVIAFIWFMLRLSVSFAASVSERTVGIAKSWQVTQGAVWGLLFYWILWFIVFLVIGSLYGIVAASGLFSLMGEMFAAAGAGNDVAVQEIEQRMMQAQLDLYDMSKPGFWTYMIATYVYTVIAMSFWTAAGGVAYRYLTGGERG